MDDLIRMCKELEKCKVRKEKGVDNIVCARIKVYSYIGNNSDKLLNLRAQIKMYNGKIDDFSVMALLVSVFSFLTSIMGAAFGQGDIDYIYFAFNLLVILLVIDVVKIVFAGSKYTTYKWVKYIETILEEMDTNNIQ